MNARTPLTPRLRAALGAGLAAALAALVLMACGDGRDTTQAVAEGRLQPPAAALADPALCADAGPAARGPLGYRRDGASCWRATTALADAADAEPRRRALATAPTRLATAAELFDWAEGAYAQFFPSRRSNLLLAGYTYRYYPESGNHLAVNDGRIYVQGPMSGGALYFVGTVTDYTCLAVPALCGLTGTDCAPITQWTAGGNTCQAGSGQDGRVASGASFTFTDNTGPVVGSATYRCSNGVLSAVGAAACFVEPTADCNTATVTWTVGANQCSPNAGDPAQVRHGQSFTFTDSVKTTGQATFQCNNGTLTALPGATCNAESASFCTPSDIQWSVSGNVCVADSLPGQISEGATYAFSDTRNGPVGRATYRCTGGNLVPEGSPTCAPPSMVDSFGGDGGAADGGAAGDGTAADGKPIVGGTVRITDTTGRVATATTDTQGYWRARLTGMVPPLLVRVTRPDGVLRHSVSFQPLRTNGYIFIATTGLTQKLTTDLANRAGLTSAAGMTPGVLASLGAPALSDVVTALRNHPVVRAELQAAGITPDAFDPLTTPFRPNGTGYDGVLDNLAVDTDGDGSVSIRTLYCTVRELSWTVGSNTCTFGSSTSSLINIANGSSLRFSDTTGGTTGAASYSCNRGVLEGPSSATCFVPK